MKNALIRVATKVLGGTHLVGQTIADLSLNAEIKLHGSDEQLEIKRVIDHRLTRTMELQAKAGIYNPFNSIAELTQHMQ